MEHRLCLLICDNFANELETVLAHSGGDDVVMATYPSCYSPESRQVGVREAVLNHALAGDRVETLGAGTLTDVTSLPVAVGDYRPHKPDTCLELFLPRAVIDHLVGQRLTLLSPGWLEHWPAHVRAWGFQRESAASLFNRFRSGLMLLDTGVYPNSRENLRQFADYLHTPFDILPVGLDMLRLLADVLIHDWRVQREHRQTTQRAILNRQQVANYTVAFDVIGDLAQLTTEAMVVERMFDMFATLFAPVRMRFTTIVNGQPRAVWHYPPQPEPSPAPEAVPDLPAGFRWSADERGFYLGFAYAGKQLGVMLLDDLAFPQRREEYLPLALTLAKVCGLALANARLLRGIVPICANCKRIKDRHGQWQPVDVYIHRHSDIDFSHGLCPACTEELYADLLKKL
jgi:hypothetical protein